jgi:L,D-transpeptidase ErfK/SrfK
MVPVGTQVRVVNQPFVFGWHEGQLYMQAFDVLEDDTRDWKKAPKKLLSKALATNIQKQLKAHDEEVNWDEVSTLSHDPRGVPVPISLADGSLDQVLASVSTVQNHLPDGSTWDGKSDLPIDEATFQQMISEIEPGSKGGAPADSNSAAPANTPPASIASPTSGTTTTAPTPPPTTGAPTGTKPRPAGPPATTAAGSQSKSAN